MAGYIDRVRRPSRYKGVYQPYMILREMRDGGWYSRPGLRKLLTGRMSYSAMKGTLQRVWRYGWVERVMRNDWRPHPGLGLPRDAYIRDRFRITPAGLAEITADDKELLFELGF